MHIIDYTNRKNIVTRFLLFELKVAYRECVLKRIDKKKTELFFFGSERRISKNNVFNTRNWTGQ